MQILVLIDNDNNLIGYSNDEELSEIYCQEENRKTYPYTHGSGVRWVPVEPMEFPSEIIKRKEHSNE